jgi:hypothetical protein
MKIRPRRVLRRQSARLLALTGLAVLIAALFASAATSGQATHFGVTVSPSTPTAGSQFTVTVQALDASGNVDKSYKGNHTLTFSGAQPAPDTTPPSYPQSQPVGFDQGVASVPVTLFNAAATTLTVSEDNTTITGSSAAFTVNHGAPAELTFTTQPPVWVAKSPASLGAAVTVKDDWGNLGTNESVSLTLNKNAAALGCPTTAGPCTATSDASSGIAAFTLSVGHDAVGYQLVASSPAPPLPASATANSSSFNVGDAYGQFANGNGPSGQDDPGTTQTNTIVNGSNNNNLALAVDGTIPVRLDLCGGLATPVGSGTVFEAVKTQNDNPQPTWTITVTVKRAALVDTARGAATYDMCIGTRNIWVASGGATGTPDCLANPSATSYSTSLSWPAKGGCAVPDGPDPATAVYWGNVLDAGKPGTGTPANIKDCSQARAPVITSKKKTGPGDLVLKLCVPFPWDGFGGSH